MNHMIYKNLSERLYSLFVVNTKAVAIQTAGNEYIKVNARVTSKLLEIMLKQNGSLGCYQQGYKSGQLRWICFDFDCKDKINPDVKALYNDAVRVMCTILQEQNINYLTEFSGRRGIHIWVIFDQMMDKAIGYEICSVLYDSFLERVKENWRNEYGLDIFPKTSSSKNNVVGAMVKFPLSIHKEGGRSYFFSNEFKEKYNVFSEEFLNEQLDLLNDYKCNELDTVLEILGIDSQEVKKRKDYKYKQYKIIDRINLSAQDAIEILSEVSVYQHIFDKLREGKAETMDWLVLLGTLGRLDSNADILKSVFSCFRIYNESITLQNINKFRDSYYPPTFEYVFSIYHMTIDPGIDPMDTGYAYLLRKIGVNPKELNLIFKRNHSLYQINLEDTVKREQNYFLSNDEVLDIRIWNDLNRYYKYDINQFQIMIDEICNGDSALFNPSFSVYERIESDEKKRLLISLNAHDRVLTTHLTLLLFDEIIKKGKIWNSFSYHIALNNKNEIFYSWYIAWKNYVQQISSYLRIPFFEKYKICVLDLKQFYDHVDLASVFQQVEKDLDQKALNILDYLRKYNDCVMRSINAGVRIGVPQGPVYARILAEMYLDEIINSISAEYGDDIVVYRYVDDIVIICNPDINEESVFDDFAKGLADNRLPINDEKSICYGEIGSLTSEQQNKILHSDKFSYELAVMSEDGIKLSYEKYHDLQNYLETHEFNMDYISYVYSSRNMPEAKTEFFKKYGINIFGSRIGRGSSYRSFYQYILSNEELIEEAIQKEMFSRVPLNSINFKNLMSTIYLMLQNDSLSDQSFDQIVNYYLNKIVPDNIDVPEQELLRTFLIVRKQYERS